jgi:hypothetical protein
MPVLQARVLLALLLQQSQAQMVVVALLLLLLTVMVLPPSRLVHVRAPEPVRVQVRQLPAWRVPPGGQLLRSCCCSAARHPPPPPPPPPLLLLLANIDPAIARAVARPPAGRGLLRQQVGVLGWGQLPGRHPTRRPPGVAALPA